MVLPEGGWVNHALYPLADPHPLPLPRAGRQFQCSPKELLVFVFGVSGGEGGGGGPEIVDFGPLPGPSREVFWNVRVGACSILGQQTGPDQLLHVTQ